MSTDIKASGIIFYRKTPGMYDLNLDKQKFGSSTYEYLLQFKKFKGKSFYEDLGGKCDDDDINPRQTAAREAAEESNGKFLNVNTDHKSLISMNRLYISKLMDEKCIEFEYKKASYVVYLVEIPYKDSNIDFGDVEIHPKYHIERKMGWIKHDDFINLEYKKVHPRIRHFRSRLLKNNLKHF